MIELNNVDIYANKINDFYSFKTIYVRVKSFNNLF